MVINMFGLKFPPKFTVSTIEVYSDRHISTVVVFFEQGWLMFLNVAFENSRIRHLFEFITLALGIYLAGANDEVFPPRPIFFDILKVDNCYSIYSNYYKI